MSTEIEQLPHTATSECAVERTISILKDRWSLLIMRDLIDNAKPMRFNQLKKSLQGISGKVLSERLDHMEGLGLVVRRVIPGSPPGVEYSLTEMGQGFNRVIEEYRAFGRKWLPAVVTENKHILDSSKSKY